MVSIYTDTYYVVLNISYVPVPITFTLLIYTLNKVFSSESQTSSLIKSFSKKKKIKKFYSLPISTILSCVCAIGESMYLYVYRGTYVLHTYC